MNSTIKIVLLFIVFFDSSFISYSQDTIYINKAWRITTEDSAVGWRNPCLDTGFCKAFYLTGELLADVRLEYGKLNGIGLFYYKNGMKMQEGIYQNELKNGEWKVWDQNGNLDYTETYKNGRMLEGVRYSQESEVYRYVIKNRKGVEVKYTLSDWAAQLSLGGAGYFYDKETRKYFGNYEGALFKLTTYYKRIFLGLEFAPATLNPLDTLIFQGQKLLRNADINIVKTFITLGYTQKLPYYFSIEPYIGYLSTSYTVINEKEIQENYDLSSAKGMTAGFLINKYIKLRFGEALVVYVNPSFNYSNYSALNPSLGNSFYALEVGIGYKGWFGKKVR